MKKRTLHLSLLGAAAALLISSAAEAAGPFQFFSVTPCRIVDTRQLPQPNGTGGPRLMAGSPRHFPIAGLCGVPTTAKAATLNVTIVSPTLDGFFKIFPFGFPPPGPISTINAAAGEPALANGAIVPLTTPGTNHITVIYGTAVPGGSAHAIIDVTGYFQ